MLKILFLSSLIFLSGSLYSQNAELIFSGNFVETPFTEFVSSIESVTTTRFFYESDLVKEVRVNASGKELKLSEVLRKVFSSTNLKFYIDNYGNVIVYKGSATIIVELPDFKQSGTDVATDVQPENADLTNAEKKYLDGKKSAENETIVAGNRQQMVPDRTYIVQGRITVRETGEPLAGATIFIEETGSGAATDPDGYFRLLLKPGKYTAKASCVSMKEKQFNMQVYSDGSIQIRMEKAIISISEVTITAKRQDNVAGMQMGFERVSTRSMKEIPAVMGERDLLKVAQLLPGVQTAGEGSSGLIVRGGTSDQNLFYLNKIPVYNTSHLFGFFTAFSQDVVSDFALYKSNIPASYGGRVSSVFDISTRQGNKKKFYGQGGISPVTGHFELEGPLIKEKSSFVVSVRSTYSDWLLSQMKDINLKKSHANFYDVTASLNTELNNRNLIKLFGYRSSDQFTLSSTDDYNYVNNGGSVSWKHLFSSSLTSDLSAVYSQYWFSHNDKQNVSEAYTHQYVLNHEEFKADFNFLTPGNHKVQFGASGILYDLDRGDILPYGEESTRISVKLGKEKGIEGALYLSDEFFIFPKLETQCGLRYSFFGQLGPSEMFEYDPGMIKNRENIKGSMLFKKNEFIRTYSGPEIRVALKYNLGTESSLKASYNRIRQYIFMLSNTMSISPDDQWKLADYYIKPPVSDQISLGYYHNLPQKGLSASLEIYQKWINDIVEYKDGISFISSEKPEMQLLQGRQNSYGLELMVKKNSGNTTGWLSYSYSRSSILVKGNIPENSINNGIKFPSNYDRPHSLNLVTNMRYSRRFSSSFNVVYSSGRPVTYPVSVYLYENKYLLCYSGRNQYRLPDYFRVDFSLSAEGNLLSKKSIHSSWMLNIYNLLGRKNAYSVFFESEEGRIKGYKLSVFAQPIVTISWNFKFGNYANE